MCHDVVIALRGLRWPETRSAPGVVLRAGALVGGGRHRPPARSAPTRNRLLAAHPLRLQGRQRPFPVAVVDGGFVMTTHVSFEPVHQYDQAGLMVRLSADCWLKTSVEYEPGATNRLGVVVTNAGYSDWSTQEVPASQLQVWLRVERSGVRLSRRMVRGWIELDTVRLGHLHEDDGPRRRRPVSTPAAPERPAMWPTSSSSTSGPLLSGRGTRRCAPSARAARPGRGCGRRSRPA